MAKMSRSHTTATKDVQAIVAIAQKEPAVTKIVLGVVQSVSGGMPNIKFTAVPAGFSVKVRSFGAVQELFIYTKDQDVPRRIEEKFNNK